MEFSLGNAIPHEGDLFLKSRKWVEEGFLRIPSNGIFSLKLVERVAKGFPTMPKEVLKIPLTLFATRAV